MPRIDGRQIDKHSIPLDALDSSGYLAMPIPVIPNEGGMARAAIFWDATDHKLKVNAPDGVYVIPTE